jgi:transcriptional regulator with XRE-family HTH domain
MPKRNINPGDGKRLAEIRKSRQLTQEQLAAALGVSVKTLQHLEHGRSHLTTGRIGQLSRALGCPAFAFFDPPDSPVPRNRSR